MEPASVGIREFRTRLAEYLLKSDKPVAVTRHGQTVGYFIPARAARADLDRAGFSEAQLDDVTRDFRAWRKSSRK
jgi:antitoxin (DNA-binding transcriptional repressor) of toxin-antitoxin stability system